jgi:hypothetical protein
VDLALVVIQVQETRARPAMLAEFPGPCVEILEIKLCPADFGASGG